jgi:hypothetical protein
MDHQLHQRRRPWWALGRLRCACGRSWPCPTAAAVAAAAGPPVMQSLRLGRYAAPAWTGPTQQWPVAPLLTDGQRHRSRRLGGR